MSNDKIINEFELLISELKNKSSDKSLPKSDITKINFKIKHFKNAVNIIKIFPKKITKGDDLKDISGIGKGIISRIDEIIKNKKLSEINRNEIKIEIWERGAGYTLASGSSSSAAGAVARKMGVCDNEIKVQMPGGTIDLIIDDDFNVQMSGPATRIASMVLDAECL